MPALVQNFWLPFNTSDLREQNKHSGAHGKSCSQNGHFCHYLRSGHNLVYEFQGKPIELPINYYWEVMSTALERILTLSLKCRTDNHRMKNASGSKSYRLPKPARHHLFQEV